MEYSKSLDKSAQISVTVKQEALFIKEFIEFWKTIRKHYCTDISDIKQVCSVLYEKYTKKFISKWEKIIPLISTSAEYLRDYYSFELTVRSDFVILIPHKLLVYDSLRQREKVFYELDRINTLSELLFFIERSCRDDNLKLNKTDVEIIKNLTSKEFIGLSERIPTITELAEFFGRHRNTIASRMNKLIDSYIISILYKINPSSLGYETYFIISESRNTSKEFEPYHLAINPVSGAIYLDEKQKQYQLILTQIPIASTNIYNTFKKNVSTLFFQDLDKEYLGWNLSTLTPEVKDRWNTPPPILSTFTWNDKVKSMDNGIEINLRPREERVYLTPLDRKVLDIYGFHNMIEDIEISRRLKVNERYIRESKSRLLINKIIHLFIHVSNIGVAFKPWITVIGENKESHRSIMYNIIEHLKFFPFLRLFYNLECTRPVLTGYIFIPESWISDFMYKWFQLNDFGLRVDINHDYSRKAKWSINITKTISTN